jgi:hypothetical protein
MLTWSEGEVYFIYASIFFGFFVLVPGWRWYIHIPIKLGSDNRLVLYLDGDGITHKVGLREQSDVDLVGQRDGGAGMRRNTSGQIASAHPGCFVLCAFYHMFTCMRT